MSFQRAERISELVRDDGRSSPERNQPAIGLGRRLNRRQALRSAAPGKGERDEHERRERRDDPDQPQIVLQAFDHGRLELDDQVNAWLRGVLGFPRANRSARVQREPSQPRDVPPAFRAGVQARQGVDPAEAPTLLCDFTRQIEGLGDQCRAGSDACLVTLPVDERDIAQPLGLVPSQQLSERLGGHWPFGVRELDDQTGDEGVCVAADHDVTGVVERVLRDPDGNSQRESRERSHRQSSRSNPPRPASVSSLAHLQPLGGGYSERSR
jgi:hypothetical protein